MTKNMRGLALLALAYIAFWPVEYSVAQDQPRARELSLSGPVRVFRKRESPVLFSQEGEVRFQKAYVDQNGSIRDLYGAVLIRRDRTHFRRGGSLDMWPARVHDVARAVGAAPHYLQLQADQHTKQI